MTQIEERLMDDETKLDRIRQIIKRCDEDLEADTNGDRRSYCQIKAFHFDSIRKVMGDREGT